MHFITLYHNCIAVLIEHEVKYMLSLKKMRIDPRQQTCHGVMAGGCPVWVRASVAQRVGNVGSHGFLSPRPPGDPYPNKQTRKISFLDSIQYLKLFQKACSFQHPPRYVFRSKD